MTIGRNMFFPKIDVLFKSYLFIDLFKSIPTDIACFMYTSGVLTGYEDVRAHSLKGLQQRHSLMYPQELLYPGHGNHLLDLANQRSRRLLLKLTLPMIHH